MEWILTNETQYMYKAACSNADF